VAETVSLSSLSGVTVERIDELPDICDYVSDYHEQLQQAAVDLA
jgi:hypothetical protein